MLNPSHMLMLDVLAAMLASILFCFVHCFQELLVLAGVPHNQTATFAAHLKNEFPQLMARIFGEGSLQLVEIIWIMHVLRCDGNVALHGELHDGLAYNRLLVTLSFTARIFEMMLEAFSLLAAMI